MLGDQVEIVPEVVLVNDTEGLQFHDDCICCDESIDIGAPVVFVGDGTYHVNCFVKKVIETCGHHLSDPDCL